MGRKRRWVFTQEVKDPWVMILPRVMILPLQEVSVLLTREEMNGWEVRTEVSLDISSRCNHNEIGSQHVL